MLIFIDYILYSESFANNVLFLGGANVQHCLQLEQNILRYTGCKKNRRNNSVNISYFICTIHKQSYVLFGERVTKTENIKTDATKILRPTLFSD